MGFLSKLFGGGGLGLDELSRRLGISEKELQACPIQYREFEVPKRSGGTRRLASPEARLKKIQRAILRKLLSRLRVHAAVHGFEKKRSIVTNALPHRGKSVVLRLDLKDFFPSTSDKRLKKYFRSIGWSGEAAETLTRLCAHRGGLPQGAPTSPRLSNLLNYRLDVRLASLAAKLGAAYTRYADDLAFSFARDDRDAVHGLIRSAKQIVRNEGYVLHQKKKLRIRRRHQLQLVTGLAVNSKVNLPRSTRRWLRAVAHRLATRGRADLNAAQLEGWSELRAMISKQSR